MTDWKALCRELVTAIESNCKEHVINHDLSCACMKADTALSQPEPEGPTDEEIKDWHSRCADLTTLGEAERYCLGAENSTGHCITSLLEILPDEDD